MLHHVIAGSGPPILLVHGTGGDARNFEGVLAALAPRHRAIAYDRQGHSRSAGSLHPTKGYYARHADDAAELLRRLDAVPAAVVGWSAGGIVALALALRHPAVVERLVLYEPPLHAKKHPTLQLAGGLGKAMLLRLVGKKRDGAAAFFRMASSLSDGGNRFDQVDAPIREAMLANADAVMRELDAGTGEELTAVEIGGLRCPVRLIIGGRSAAFLRAAGDRLAKIIPGIEVVRVADAGHTLNLDDPARFAELVW